MTDVRQALWRVEYCTDLAKGSAPSIPLGFLLESHWKNQARWLGLVFRRRLTALELDRVDALTWPELLKLEPFMTELFGEAWRPGVPSSTDLVLGSEVLAARFSAFGALQFVREEASQPLTAVFTVEHSFQALYGRLLGFRNRLQPVFAASVVKLPRRRIALVGDPDQVDVELLNKAA